MDNIDMSLQIAFSAKICFTFITFIIYAVMNSIDVISHISFLAKSLRTMWTLKNLLLSMHIIEMSDKFMVSIEGFLANITFKHFIMFNLAFH